MLDANVAEAPVVTREKLVVGTTSLEAIAQDKGEEKPRTSEPLPSPADLQLSHAC
jgi:hypothetical protein